VKGTAVERFSTWLHDMAGGTFNRSSLKIFVARDTLGVKGVCPGSHFLKIVVFRIVAFVTGLTNPLSFLGLGMTGATTPVGFSLGFTFAGVMVAVPAIQPVTGLAQMRFMVKNNLAGFGLIGQSHRSFRGSDGKSSKTE